MFPFCADHAAGLLPPRGARPVLRRDICGKMVWGVNR